MEENSKDLFSYIECRGEPILKQLTGLFATVIYSSMYDEQQSISSPRQGLDWTPLFVHAYGNVNV